MVVQDPAMPLFGNRRSPTPRLKPELDDKELGRVRKQLDTSPISSMREIQADQIERILRAAGTDWDRRSHRISVLADKAADSNLSRFWLLRNPKNADALLFQAWVDLVRARQAGAATDAQVTAERCYRAAELRQEDPTPWVVLLGLMRVQRRSQREVFAVWQEVVDRDRSHREAHLQMLGYLSPEESGSNSQVLDFLDSVRSQGLWQSPVAALELTAEFVRYRRAASGGGVGELLADKIWHQARATAVLDHAVANWKPGVLRHAAALADLNLLAYVLVQAKRSADAAEIFGQLGGTVTAWPWQLSGNPVDEFTYWRSHATR
ncbi:hypothetical protein [Kitasatospora sp. MAP12-44]|uniref:hypothetical protein n=1 Tax=unclassified Kitasatospora TaxID=2633591 RepID=UPI0024744FD3|nr:hypothetical protein [Kitasatospora sp. MAP12-44]